MRLWVNKLPAIAVLAVFLAVVSCNRIDDKRIPGVNVNVVFSTEGMWAKYGVSGAMEWRRFIRSTSNPVPQDFPYTVNSYTGYGGILLVGDYYGNALAYDLSCPFEAKPDIRVNIDPEAHDAVCPVCGSTYDVFGGQGRPTSGPSAERGYGLTRYNVVSGGTLYYRVITR